MRTLWYILPYRSGYISGCRIVSSTPSFDTSLVLKLSGSSSTSPSRLPRMLVENQPRMPSMRAFMPGARIVFINVWPVLKSLPLIGTHSSRDSFFFVKQKTAYEVQPLIERHVTQAIDR